MQDVRIGLITRTDARNQLPWNRGLFAFSKRKSLWMACLLITFCAALGGCFATQPVTPPAPAPGLIVLLSDGTPAFAGVQREITKKYPRKFATYTLGDESTYPALRKKIESANDVVVAVGLPAAQLARGLSGKKVIFCQVFNYEEAELVAPLVKGVSATPPVREQFRVWKMLSPGLKKVGVITGKNLRGFIDEARAAAAENRIKLIRVEVRSDKETLYAYKQLAPKIQGLWLVPDNRVLSHEVIRDIMSYSVKQGKQIAVFSHELLGLGGLVSAESSYADIAEQVLVRIKQAQEYVGVPGAPVAALTKADTRINAVMASRLNLTLPRILQGMAHAP